jgi:hypothetical protein
MLAMPERHGTVAPRCRRAGVAAAIAVLRSMELWRIGKGMRAVSFEPFDRPARSELLLASS